MCFKLYALAFVLIVLGSIGVDATPKDTMISKIKTLVSNFANDNQLSKIIDSVSNNMYNGATQEKIADDMLSVVLTSLSGTQLLKGLDINTKITAQLGGQAKADATLDKINAVVTNQVQDTYDQIQAKTKTMKANGQAKAAIVDAGLKIANEAFTQQLMQKVVSAIKNKLTANEWSVVRKNLDGVVFFSKYGV
ncbi:hypothetical protein AAVH_06645 [Aphelenchoides avenae]|nr:hypothetical protein AAVH_06645 [Aphelenchus avenae]